jgi:flavin reductase (DIM6/NTAB) family NADH-FMN oxidoreductase RutF
LIELNRDRDASFFASNILRARNRKLSTATLVPENDDNQIAHKLRLTLRHVPSSIAIITSSPVAPTGDSKSSSAGMTVSSLTSVCLHPRPIVSFNIKLPSTTYSALKGSGSFLVHLISSTKDGAELASCFTTPGGLDNLPDWVQTSSLRIGNYALPRLEGDTIRAVLVCRVLDDELRVGDHVVVLGEVMDIDNSGHEKEGLLYFDQKYRGIGPDLA